MLKRRKYHAEFKREALQSAAMLNGSLQSVAKYLGINEGRFIRWKHDLETQCAWAFVGHVRVQELMLLCRELAKMRQEMGF